ncbi:AP-1 complex subunit mu-2 isoform X2 [Gopherus evgoodei]|uniref:AP-1 complex subunit mu-2 isoform X2 n=1 Tax=Gopherus evgoodei TaxID=1825980 RepID=UPI0011CF2049|nr:AP-1 complex subunit mu-2 isoform X2 [Gopherus evgoodei]
MSASAVFVLDLKGKPLISRNYKGDVSMAEIDHFMPLLMQKEEEGALTPLLTHGKVHFLWIKHTNLYLVATTMKNANASLVYSFLYKVVEVFSEYFKELEEESIRDNFVVIYELLDELMDFGFPQTTDSKILQEYITQQGNKLETGKSHVPPTVTNAVSWRSEGIKYKKNEVFIDVIESVNLLVNSNGSVLLSEIVGTIKLKVFLSGMPELRLGLNDRMLFELTGRHKNKSVELEDVKFHQCVRLSRFENDRTISFIPPDGDFELMSYRLNTQHPGQGCLTLCSPPLWEGEAPHLDRVGHREVLPQPRGDHGEGKGPVQEAVGGQQRGDLGPCPQRRRLPQVQDQRWQRQVRA